MKIAVVHDYFTQLGGAEKVAEELMRLFPEADLHSTVALPDRMPRSLLGTPVSTSWMQKLPRMRQCYRLYFPLYPLAVSSLDLSRYDLVISSSSGYAKGVRASREAIHVCYCHSPMRWAWSFDTYAARENLSAIPRLVLPSMARLLRKWDEHAARQPDHFIANSKAVAARIRRSYGRSAEVIHPPIDIDRFHLAPTQDDYYLVLARLISYKRIDLAVQACTRLGRSLVVIGDGPDRKRLMSMAGPTVRFLGRLPDAQVAHYAARCQALLFPGEEDFGMAPLEVAAAGRPTIAFRAGGAIETIIEGRTGLFFDEGTPEALCDAVEEFEKSSWSALEARHRAQDFSIPVFQSRMTAFLSHIGVSLLESSVSVIAPVTSAYATTPGSSPQRVPA
jgi:glycosyltransferase involved in cell wall biosynthesis